MWMDEGTLWELGKKQELKKIFGSKWDSEIELSMTLRCMGYSNQMAMLQ
jgi:hypothetical protein